MSATTLTRPTVALSMSGCLVGVLAGGGHLPAAAERVPADDPHRALNLATARWHEHADRMRVGSGWRYTGHVTGPDAARILGYLDSVCRPLEDSADADYRETGREIRLGITTAVNRLRQRGATVTTRTRNRQLTYTVKIKEEQQ